MTPTITPEEAERALSVVDDHMSTPEGYALALSTLRSFISQYKAQATRIETLEEALKEVRDILAPCLPKIGDPDASPDDYYEIVVTWADAFKLAHASNALAEGE